MAIDQLDTVDNLDNDTIFNNTDPKVLFETKDIKESPTEKDKKKIKEIFKDNKAMVDAFNFIFDKYPTLAKMDSNNDLSITYTDIKKIINNISKDIKNSDKTTGKNRKIHKKIITKYFQENKIQLKTDDGKLKSIQLTDDEKMENIVNEYVTLAKTKNMLIFGKIPKDDKSILHLNDKRNNFKLSKKERKKATSKYYQTLSEMVGEDNEEKAQRVVRKLLGKELAKKLENINLGYKDIKIKRTFDNKGNIGVFTTGETASIEIKRGDKINNVAIKGNTSIRLSNTKGYTTLIAKRTGLGKKRLNFDNEF